MLRPDVRVKENTIKIADNDSFIECLHYLYKIILSERSFIAY